MDAIMIGKKICDNNIYDIKQERQYLKTVLNNLENLNLRRVSMEKVLKMEASIGMITYGLFMISLGIMLLVIYSRNVDLDVIKFSHESHKARQLWGL